MFYFIDKFYYVSSSLSLIFIILILSYFWLFKKENNWSFFKYFFKSEESRINSRYFDHSLLSIYDTYIDNLDNSFVGQILEERPEILAYAFLVIDQERKNNEDRKALKSFIEGLLGVKHIDVELKKEGWLEDWY